MPLPWDSLTSGLFLYEAVPVGLKHSCESLTAGGWVHWSRKGDVGGHQQHLLLEI